jgi:hypothetical protein
MVPEAREFKLAESKGNSESVRKPQGRKREHTFSRKRNKGREKKRSKREKQT